MSEYDIAEQQVRPSLINDLGFPSDCIEGYGRVPIQVGQMLVWGDYVCYYYSGNKKVPFCVVEVKECNDDCVDFAIPQAESYAQRIDAPFFCCTNGTVYNWFMTGAAQGGSLRLSAKPTLPDASYLKKPKKVYISPYLYEAIRNFESNIKNEGAIHQDSEWHSNSTQNLNTALWNNQILADPKQMINCIDQNTMQSRGKAALLDELKNNYGRFLDLIEWLKDDTKPIDERLENAIGKNSKYGIQGGGFFFVTQIIAGLFPNEFTVIEENAVKAMLRFELVNINLKVESVKEYLYFNQICRELFPFSI